MEKDILIELMHKANIPSQTELADRIGISKQSVNAWFTDKRIIKLSTLIEIAEKLELKLSVTIEQI